MKLTPSSGMRRSVRSTSVAVGGLAPDAAPGDAHGAEAEAVDRELAADPEGAGRGGVGGLCCVRCFAWHGEVLCVAGCNSDICRAF